MWEQLNFGEDQEQHVHACNGSQCWCACYWVWKIGFIVKYSALKLSLKLVVMGGEHQGQEEVVTS